ncbi:MAG: aryl-sulfate sulfotransferase [Gemmatimonadaceae bacterium]
MWQVRRQSSFSRIQGSMTVIRYGLCSFSALVVFLSACDDPLEPAGRGHIVSAAIDSAGGPILRTITVELDVAAPIEVSYAAEGTPILTVSADSSALLHTLLLPRLRANREYSAEVVIPDHESSVLRTAFGTGALPPALAAVQLEETGDPTRPVALIEIAGGNPFHGLLAVEDGEIVGYMEMAGPLFGSTRRSNGEIVLLDNELGLVSRRWDGSVAHTLPQLSSNPAAAYGRIHHDVTATPQNTLLFIANEQQAVGGETVVGEALWEWNPATGSVVKRWSAFDHLTWHGPAGRSTLGNWLHGNGISYGPRGNVLMSLRNINQIISIAPDFSRVEWKMGGIDGSLAVSDADRFYGQHYVSEPALNRVLVYDNGFQRPGGAFTRAIEYELDLTAGTAKAVWQYRHTPEIFAALVGSVIRLPNGNAVVLFGMKAGEPAGAESTGPLTAVEVNQGAVVWRLTVRDGALTRLYRLTSVASLVGERPGAFRN